jgi:hypothetical protein
LTSSHEQFASFSTPDLELTNNGSRRPGVESGSSSSPEHHLGAAARRRRRVCPLPAALRRVAEFTHAIGRVADSRGQREREESGCLKPNLEVTKMESSAAAGWFRTFHLGGAPGGLADFLVHLGPGLEALWQVPLPQ